jgi:hypothetical protein
MRAPRLRVRCEEKGGMGLIGVGKGVGSLGLDRVWGCVHHVDPCGPDIARSGEVGQGLVFLWRGRSGGFMRVGLVPPAPS